MNWETILFRLYKLITRAELRPYANEFVRWMMDQLLADPLAGDNAEAERRYRAGETLAFNLETMALEFYKLKGILTHEENCKRLARELAIAAADRMR